DRHFAEFERAIDRESGDSVEEAGENAPEPGTEAGAIGEMSPAAEKRQRGGEQGEADDLHVECGPTSAGLARGKSHEKIGTTPTEGGEQTEEDAHWGSGWLAFFHF